MLVYANSFELDGEDGYGSATLQIARWVGIPRKAFIDPSMLALGSYEMRFTDGAILTSAATPNDGQEESFPYLFNARLVHGQAGVPGRKWVTEIGLVQSAFKRSIQCSILLKTEEISARAYEPIQVTRPKIVELLIDNCRPSSNLPGLQIKSLTNNNADAFLQEVERIDRRYPIVVVSCDRAGRYPVDSQLLQSVLVGLAQVVEIPSCVDTFRLEKVLGRRYVAFAGAINIIFRYRQKGTGSYCNNALLLADKIDAIRDSGLEVKWEVLSIVTHQTNLVNSWKHTSQENVRDFLLRKKLQHASHSSEILEESAAYEELLKEAADQLNLKDSEISFARSEIELREESIENILSENESLKYRLSAAQSRARESVASVGLNDDLVQALRALTTKTPSLRQALMIVENLYPGRLVVLNSAYSSAEESDRAAFQFGFRAAELLMILAGTYWESLSEGRGDQQAKSAFGKNFASKEAESLSNDGKRRRTFNYNNKDITMEKHIKHGVKNSKAETLRIHFEWNAEEKKIVIGHCGKHLDF